MAQAQIAQQNLGSLNFTATSDADQFARTAPVVDLAGAAVDLSAWNDIQIIVKDQNGSVTFVDNTANLITKSKINDPTDIMGGADGRITIHLAASDLAQLPRSGQFSYVCKGKVLVGDAMQVLGSGLLATTPFQQVP